MPTLDLASLSGVLTVPANGSVVIRNLRLTGVLLPTSPYPLPASSFVVPSALRLPPRGSAPSSASPPPPLELSNVLLSTPSCAALSIHQTLACSAAPSPNFTVTPSALVVHRYTSPAADLTNVTLVCVGRPAPYPCLASVADTGADALEAIRTMQGQAQALAASDLTPGLPPISNLYLRGHVILSESSDDDQPARLQPIALEVGRLVIAGAADGTTTLDLAGTSSLITVSLDASVQLHNLTLANPPVGPLSESPYRLLRLPLWTFSFPRMLLGSSLGPILAVEGGTVRDIPPEEMAAYFADLGYPNVEFDDPEFGSTPGPVPPALAPCFCIWAIDIFTSVRGMQDPGSAVGLLLSEVETWSTRMVMRDVRLVAATTPAAHAEAAAPAVTALSAPAPGADPLGPAACQSSPLCKLFPAGERTLANALDFKLSMVRQQTVRSLSLVELSFVNNGFADTGAFALAMPVVSVVVDPSNEELQTSEPVNKTARVERPGVIAGDPWAAVVLDLNELRNAINISGSKAALSIQYCVLVGLPSAAKGLGGGARGSTPAPAPLAPVVGPVSPGEGVGPSTELSGGPNVGGGAGAQLTAAPRAGTQGLAPSLANLTSCLWSMDFDRVNATPPEQRITDLPYVSLDSVVLLVPQPELALLAWAWALGSRAGGAEEAAAALAAVTSNAGLAGELAAMALRSRLEPDSAAAALVAATIASSSLSTPDTALGAFAATTSVTFATLSWCGLVGRNVTLASQLPPSLIDLALTGGLAPERLQPPALGLPWAALQPWSVPGRPAPNPPANPPPHNPSPASPLHAGMSNATDGSSPAAPPASAQPTTDSGSKQAAVGLIVGCAIGGVAALALAFMAVLILNRRRRARYHAQAGPATMAADPSGSSGPAPKDRVSLPSPESCTPSSGPTPPTSKLGPGGSVGGSADLECASGARELPPASCSPILAFWQSRSGRGRGASLARPALGTPRSQPKPAAACGPPRPSDSPSLPGSQATQSSASVFKHELAHMYVAMHDRQLPILFGRDSTASLKSASAHRTSHGTGPGPARASLPGAGSSSAWESQPRLLSQALEGEVSGLMSQAQASQDQGVHSDAMLVISGELGRGAQGVVYRGTWRGLPVAVKSMLLQCDGGGGRERVRRAIQEAAISASVSQPHVVATYTHLLQRMGAEDGFGPSSAPAPATGSDLQLSSDTRSSRILATQQGAELQVWKLTLVQELCDATSVRVCLDNGALARCRSVPQQPAPQPSVRILRIPGSSCSGGATSGACSTASNDWAPVVLPAMQRASPPEEPVPPSEGLLYPRVALSVALHAARGLAHLHSLGIVHGDVSSSNILLQSARPRQLPAPTSMSGAAGAATAGQPGSAGLGAERDAHGFGYVAKVCDFGSSGRLDAAGEQTHLTGPARRSSAYSAPELVRSGHAGPSGDVYALALVAWELAWGASLPSLLSRPEGSGLQAWLTQQALADPAEATALPPGLLPWPPHLPPALPELAAACLREAAAERPKMAEVCQRLEGMLG